ncbi:flap endonuclease GEN-like 1 [Iris pallida]|nr:flap endonuclease GEN-like 1 [Iris pallida]
MIAIALLVGNDHDLHGVHGFGVDTAIRFVKLFSEDEVLSRLSEVGSGVVPQLQESSESSVELRLPSSDEGLVSARSSHCSQCGHPGSKRAHLKFACEHCTGSGQNCIEKPAGFRCECVACDQAHKVKELKKHENWQIKVCEKIALTKNFPNKKVIDIYLCNDLGSHSENDDLSIRWDKPNVESLVDFLAYHQNWKPSYIRQRMLPMLSTIFLREMAINPKEALLLHDQYEFHSIQRVKIRHGHPYYVVKWKRASGSTDNVLHNISNEQAETEQSDSDEVGDSNDPLDESDMPVILVDDGCWYLLTDENMELVQAAFPKLVEKFLEEKRLKESKSKQRKVSKNIVGAADNSESPQSSASQLSITQFYRTTKLATQAKPGEDPENSSCKKGQSTEKRKTNVDLDRRIPKSVKRRLLFD